MAKNLLVINVDLRETRVALIEEGIIAELHVERASTRSTLGNIVLGKVTRVLPGMQAAFIDIGQERAAFLHVEDLIRPDDFEAYLQGGKRPEEDDSAAEEPAAPTERSDRAGTRGGPRGERGGGKAVTSPDVSSLDRHSTPLDVAAARAASDDLDDADDAEEANGSGESDDFAATGHGPADEQDRAEGGGSDTASKEGAAFANGRHDAMGVDESDPEEDDADDEDADDADEIADGDDADDEGDDAAPEDDADADGSESGDESAEADEPDVDNAMTVPAAEGLAPGIPAEAPSIAAAGADVTSGLGASGAPQAVAPRSSGQGTERGRQGGDRRGRDERGRQGGKSGEGENAEGRTFRSKRSARMRNGQTRGRGRDGGRDAKQGRGGRNGQRDASRLSRSTPIREVVREGQEVIVQVSKEPIGTKGARVTSHISLPGRYVVYMPTIDQIGISKRIGSDKERARLREAIESLKPPSGGLIVRTVAEGLTKKQLKADVGYLVRLWEDVAKKRDSGGKAPTSLYQELDLVLKTARDLFTDDITQIVIDDKEQYHRLVRFVEMFMPERAKDIVLYSGDEPIFDAYGIEDEIGRALSRKVPLPSGGYLIIDQAEALTAIDVNTGRYVGKGSKDLEDTLYKTNLEAVEEIAYQLRFRNLGGLIVLDLIDMDRASNREKVRRRLEDLLQKDKAKTTLNRISDLGLIEMTRKRTRESLGRLLHEPCFYCDGTGQLQSKQTVAYEILRQIRRDRSSLPGYSVVVNAHPAVIDLMKSEEKEAVQEAERRFMRRIELVARREYHLEQFDLVGK
jgi:ribonuclease G